MANEDYTFVSYNILNNVNNRKNEFANNKKIEGISLMRELKKRDFKEIRLQILCSCFS
ncbi:MAG: hypothetical protein ACXWFB_13355 [Nitrososphaeraceae archaeon]